MRKKHEGCSTLKALDPNDLTAKEIYLFAFKGKFHQIESGSHNIITDAEVKPLLDSNPETELYYICTNSGMTELAPCRTIGKPGMRFSISSRISKRSGGTAAPALNL